MTGGRPAPSTLAARLARALPDTPVWVDVRGMLLSGRAEVTGGASLDTGFVVRVLSGALSVVGVVGAAPRAAIRDALVGIPPQAPVIARRGNEAHVRAALAADPAAGAADAPPWTAEIAVLHGLDGEASAGPAPALPVRLLTAADPLDHLPPDLATEMRHARALVPVGVAVDGGRPVSFCYPCWITESLWDVSIDTLDPWRRRGLAAATARFMIARMRARGLAPSWGAMVSNTGSLRLASRLGFRPAGEVVVFSRGPWGSLTRGFDAPGTT